MGCPPNCSHPHHHPSLPGGLTAATTPAAERTDKYDISDLQAAAADERTKAGRLFASLTNVDVVLERLAAFSRVPENGGYKPDCALAKELEGAIVVEKSAAEEFFTARRHVQDVHSNIGPKELQQGCSCEECNKEAADIICSNCYRGWHKTCMQGPLPQGDNWFCPHCRYCRHCFKLVPGDGPTCRWRRAYSCCSDCGNKMSRSFNCGSCGAPQQRSRMVCCESCDKWVHVDVYSAKLNRVLKCSSISFKEYMSFVLCGVCAAGTDVCEEHHFICRGCEKNGVQWDPSCPGIRLRSFPYKSPGTSRPSSRRTRPSTPASARRRKQRKSRTRAPASRVKPTRARRTESYDDDLDSRGTNRRIRTRSGRGTVGGGRMTRSGYHGESTSPLPIPASRPPPHPLHHHQGPPVNVGAAPVRDPKNTQKPPISPVLLAVASQASRQLARSPHSRPWNGASGRSRGGGKSGGMAPPPFSLGSALSPRLMPSPVVQSVPLVPRHKDLVTILSTPILHTKAPKGDNGDLKVRNHNLAVLQALSVAEEKLVACSAEITQRKKELQQKLALASMSPVVSSMGGGVIVTPSLTAAPAPVVNGLGGSAADGLVAAPRPTGVSGSFAVISSGGRSPALALGVHSISAKSPRLGALPSPLRSPILTAGLPVLQPPPLPPSSGSSGGSKARGSAPASKRAPTLLSLLGESAAASKETSDMFNGSKSTGNKAGSSW